MRLPCLTRPDGCDRDDLVIGYVLGAVGAECDFKRRVTRCDVVIVGRQKPLQATGAAFLCLYISKG